MSFFIAAQIVGAVAVVISLIVFQLDKRETMLKFAMGAAALYAIHFFLLGAMTAAAMGIIAVGRSYIFTKIQPGKKNSWVLLVIIGVAAIATALTWQGPISLLPLGGVVAHTVGFWQNNPKSMRKWSLVAPPLWFTYDAIIGSYPGMFIEVAMIVSILIGRYRLDFGRKHHLRRHLARPA